MAKTRTKKTQTSKPATRDRVVYEVKGQHGIRQVDAATTAELKKFLAQTLDLEPYSLQAAAHLAHTERATVSGQGWSVKRLGVLAFVPDAPPAAPARKQQPENDSSPVMEPAAPATEMAPQAEVMSVEVDSVLDRLTSSPNEQQTQQPEETTWTP